MEISSIQISNFKAIHKLSTPLSRFCCIIGENNSGKSSLLQTILLLIKGTKLSSQDYYDPSSEIVITAEIKNIIEQDLTPLVEEHREKIRPLIRDGRLTLIRRYSQDRTSKLLYVKREIKEEKFKDDNVGEILKGKTGKDIEKTLKEHFPELGDNSTGISKQKEAKDLITKFVQGLPGDRYEDVEDSLPTGIENSIKAFLPEPIYIPAVKDILDDIKTTESATFGKLLSVLLNVIEPQLDKATETFEILNKQLNKVVHEDGKVSDERLKQVVEIEENVQKYVQETFPNVAVDISIPPPEVKTILTNARIQVDDGMKGTVESKGDGFKRTITFAIMRSYLELSGRPEWQKESEKGKTISGKYIFLFEEPELYLHPRSQKILFNALSKISEHHQVFVSTHSPLFFSHEATGTFIKMIKRPRDAVRPKPFAEALPIDISEITCRDQFQLISYDTSNVSFFANSVVLVEGDSDLIVSAHLSKLLNPSWDFENGSVFLVKVNGKGSFKRYKEFFKRFETKIFIITDLDCMIKDFDKLEAGVPLTEQRTLLLQKIDKVIDHNLKAIPPKSPKETKDAVNTNNQKALFEKMCEMRESFDKGKCQIGELFDSIKAFFDFEKDEPRLTILKSDSNEEITALKRQILAGLRNQNIFILEKGDIESYYPEAVTGNDKPSKAQCFCKLVKTKEDVLKLCNSLADADKAARPEFELIFEKIFC